MKRVITAVLTALISTVLLPAQGFDPTVEVSRSYDVRLGEIHKPVLPVEVPDTLSRFGHTTDYSIFEKPYGNLYEFTPYDALRIKPMDPVRLPLFYARLGLQMPIAPLLDIHLQKASKKGMYFDLALHHNSFFGGVPDVLGGDPLSLRNTDNDAAAHMKIVWATGEAGFGLNYKYDSRYTVSGTGATAAGGLQRYGFSAGLRSTTANEKDIYYDFNLRYDGGRSTWLTGAMTDPLAVNINGFSLDGWVGTTFDIHRIYIDMAIRFSDYAGFKDYSISVVEFSPIYEYSNKRFEGRFGVKFGNRFGLQKSDAAKAPDGNNLNALSNVFPDIDARYELSRRALWIHAILGGGFDLNDYGDLADRVPLLTPNTPMLMGNRPLEATLALESVISGRFAMNFSGSFVMQRCTPVFEPVVPTDGSPAEIRLGFVSANTLVGGLDAFWKSSTVTTGGELRLRHYFALEGEAPVTQLPVATGRLYFRYNWRERLIGSLDYDFRSSVSGNTFGAWSTPWIHNLGLTVDYVVNHNLTLYGKLGNLLGFRNQYVPLYVEPGFNFGGGIALIF